MAWTEKRGDVYRAGWRDGNGDRRYKSGFRNQKAALTHAVNEEQATDTAAAKDAHASFGDWLDRWLSVRNVEASTDKRDRERIEKHVRPRWGAVAVSKITKLAAEEWVRDLDDLVAAWTVRRIWSNFATPLRWAHERGARLSSPLPYMLSRGTLPTPGPGHERYLERELLPALERQLGGYPTSRLAVQLLFGTGMRFSELAGLHWQRVDLDAGLIHIVETWDRDGRQIKGYPKSRQARSVPIPDWLAESLAAADRGLGDCGQRHESGTLCQSPLVVRGVKGGPLNREHFANDAYKPALAAIGAPALRIHDSRHTYASWLIQSGRSIGEVSELLGHHSVVVTQKYTHRGGSHWAGVREALSRGSAAPPEPPEGDNGGDSGNSIEQVGTVRNLKLVV
jgi:integrase